MYSIAPCRQMHVFPYMEKRLPSRLKWRINRWAMKEKLLETICCPECRGDLSLLPDAARDSATQDILHGFLECQTCHACYAIDRGVPVLLKERKVNEITQKAYTDQWSLSQTTVFKDQKLFGFNIEDYLNLIRYVFDTKDIAQLRWRSFLDAGCGSGQLTVALAQTMAETEVIGLDLSDTVFSIYQEFGHLPNLHLVKGDILSPPFKDNALDVVFSSGVLHHLPQPQNGFKKLWQLCRSNSGQFYFWVYPNYNFCLYDWVRQRIKIGPKISAQWRRVASWALTPFMWLFFAVTKKYSYKDHLESWPTIAFRLFDNLSPEYQFRYSREDIAQWCQEEGIVKFKIINDLGVICTK